MLKLAIWSFLLDELFAFADAFSRNLVHLLVQSIKSATENSFAQRRNTKPFLWCVRKQILNNPKLF